MRTWNVLLAGLTALSLSFAATAADMNLNGLNKRFVFKRTQDGKLDSVKMKFFSKGFTIAPYLQQIKEDVKAEIRRMQNKSEYQGELTLLSLNWKKGSQTLKRLKKTSALLGSQLKTFLISMWTSPLRRSKQKAF